MTRDEFLALPNLLWCVFYDQASVADPVLDLVGDLDQNTIIGTTVFTGDIPWPALGGTTGPPSTPPASATAAVIAGDRLSWNTEAMITLTKTAETISTIVDPR